MKRQVSLEEISDGKLYGKNDMVRADCRGCRNCSACCRGMGSSAILDPLDIYRLTVGLSFTFEELMTDKIELNVVDGVILPNLKMSADDEKCAFLDNNGRCSIHAQRPGICRLFPLGRYYEADEPAGTAGQSAESRGGEKNRENRNREDLNGEDRSGEKRNEENQNSGNRNEAGLRKKRRGFRYFLQIHECPIPNKTKVKVSKWIDTPDLNRYERFVNEWHYFLEDVQKRLEREADEEIRKINLFLLKLFYIRPYGGDHFYEQFEERLMTACEALDFVRQENFCPIDAGKPLLPHKITSDHDA